MIGVVYLSLFLACCGMGFTIVVPYLVVDDTCLENVNGFCILLFRVKGLGKLLLANVVSFIAVK